MFIRNVRVTQAIPYNIGSAQLLGVTVSKSKDGKQLSLLIVNKAMKSPETVYISAPNAESVSAETLYAPSVIATNEGNPDNVSIKPLNAEIVNGRIKVALPEHSLTGLTIKLRPH